MGAVLRYWLGGRVQSLAPMSLFPWGTLVVNVIGCLVIGAVAQLVEARATLTPNARLFVMVGVVGGFTTFSAFANETLNGFREGASGVAIANIVASIALGLLAVWAGRAAVATALR